MRGISRNVLLASVTSIRNHQQFNDLNKKTSKHFSVVIAYRVNRVQLARLNLFVSVFFYSFVKQSTEIKTQQKDNNTHVFVVETGMKLKKCEIN